MTQPLIICGSIALDRIMNFKGKYRDLIHPDRLHVLSISVLLDTLEKTPGGSGANIAYYAALLGDTPILFDSAGDDAKEYLADLTRVGVNTESVHISTLPTASFNVMTDMEDNQIGGFYPGAMSDAGSLSLKPWADKDPLVCIAAHDPGSMRAQTEECKQRGLRLVYDPGQQVSNVSGEDLAAGIEAAEILIVNDYEFQMLVDKTGIAPETIKSKVPIVITTYGKDGSSIDGSRLESPLTVAAATPNQVLDPTGAGDAYRAGFLHGHLRQWDLRVCGQLGSVLASFVVEQHGTQRAISKQMVTERYTLTFNEELEL